MDWRNTVLQEALLKPAKVKPMMPSAFCSTPTRGKEQQSASRLVRQILIFHFCSKSSLVHDHVEQSGAPYGEQFLPHSYCQSEPCAGQASRGKAFVYYLSLGEEVRKRFFLQPKIPATQMSGHLIRGGVWVVAHLR